MSKNFQLPNSSLPKYEQVRQLLEKQLKEGVYGSGAKLPGEEALGKKLGVSNVTVRQAFVALTRQGLLVRFPYRGTFVASSDPSNPLFPTPARKLQRILVLVGQPRPDWATVGRALSKVRQGHILQAFEKAISGGDLSCRVKHIVRGEQGQVLEPEEGDEYGAAFLLGNTLTCEEQTNIALELRTARIPLVASDYFGKIPVHCVQERLDLGVELALNHFESLGHRRIAFLTFDSSEHWGVNWPWLEERKNAFLLGCEQRHWYNAEKRLWSISLPPFAPGIDSGKRQQVIGEHLAERFIAEEGYKTCTAVLAVNDRVALAFRSVMQKHGLPEISVIGFDNIPEASDAGLTTILSPAQEIGSEAAALIMNFLNGDIPRSFRSFDCTPFLLSRSSTHPLQSSFSPSYPLVAQS
jgi:DNA-binding LacI/PurR family transcriptional regulator/DNA-binding transcriptional regulator YhcF (GntR family)